VGKASFDSLIELPGSKELALPHQEAIKVQIQQQLVNRPKKLELITTNVFIE
jgi:hypothetical protein